MNTKEFSKVGYGRAMKLFAYMSEIDDAILEEAELADIATYMAAARKRYVRYGTVAAAASFGVGVAFLLIRSRRLASAGRISAKTA